MESNSLGDARRWRQRRDIMLLVLTSAAGYVDAIGYLSLGRVFTANMTGNTVLLGVHLGQEQGGAVLRSLVALAGFGAGLLIGGVIVERAPGTSGWPTTVTAAFALEALLLAAFAILWHVTVAAHEAGDLRGLIALSAAAMGIQSASVRRLNVPGIATTYVTGTLTSMVTGLVAGARPADEATRSGSWWRAVRLQMLALIVYGAGAALGGVIQARWPMLCAAWPLAAVTLVVIAAPRVPRAAPGH
jgi:uncharacterized membrane protein YoaK (UPF0700 family)